MARPTSADPAVSFIHGTSEGQQDITDPDPGRVADEQTLAATEQTLADSDQTLSDADQTSSEQDQASADRDQLAADRDQVASDGDLAHGADPQAHERSHDIREGTARERERTSRGRDETGRARLSAADRRDAIASRRDLAAQLRDEAAAARAIAMSELDAGFEQHDDAREQSSADAIIRAAGRLRRAAERRAQAAAYRELAGEDRQSAARDREEAAQERLDGLRDREALVAEVQHEQARRSRALRHQHRAEGLAEALQCSLSPSRLPRVQGLDVAVHHEPFALAEVGGDFYDLFALAGSRAGFFLGDVCGKGAQAAAVTSLARYTMRTAAMLHESPDAILHDLNRALHMGAEEVLTCTAVYGQIDMSAAAAAITLAVGGHPAPFVVRAGGSVEQTPAHGTLLGAVEHPVFQTCELSLGLGDTLVVYSDGILDSEIDGAPVTEEHIIDGLSGSPHASASDLVSRLVGLMRRVDRALRDDIAFMALRRTPAA